MKERCILEAYRGKMSKGGHSVNDLPYSIEIVIGMKMMVTNNIETDLNITNGACGEIIDIILHPDEPVIDPNKAVVQLKYMPAYLLVKLSQTRATHFKGLDACVIPVEPATTNYQIQVPVGGKMIQPTVQRKQQQHMLSPTIVRRGKQFCM